MLADADEPFVAMESADLDALEARMRSTRRRRIRLGIVGATGLLLAALGMTLLTSALYPATDVISTGMQVLVVTNITQHGTISFNGQRQPLSLFQSFHLLAQQTSYTLAINAAPFATHTCAFHWRNQAVRDLQGACQEQPDQHYSSDLSHVVVITMGFTLHDLRPAQYTQIQQALHQAIEFAPPINVPPGNYYAAGQRTDGTVIPAVATEPLLASRGQGINLAGAHSDGALPDLSHITAMPPAGQMLLAFPQASDVWRFTTLAGQEVGHLALAQTCADRAISVDLATFAITAAPFIPAATSCPLVQDCWEGDMLLHANISLAHLSYVILINQAPKTESRTGCALDILQITPASDPTTSPLTPTAAVLPRVLFRFGVLLAANDAAHTLLPDLPIAPFAELADVA